jgi:hypothetical protein
MDDLDLEQFDAIEYATLEWVDWFNNRRLMHVCPCCGFRPRGPEQGGGLNRRTTRQSTTHQPSSNNAFNTSPVAADCARPDHAAQPSPPLNSRLQVMLMKRKINGVLYEDTTWRRRTITMGRSLSSRAARHRFCPEERRFAVAR